MEELSSGYQRTDNKQIMVNEKLENQMEEARVKGIIILESHAQNPNCVLLE